LHIIAFIFFKKGYFLLDRHKKIFQRLEIIIYYNFKELRIDHNIDPKEKN